MLRNIYTLFSLLFLYNFIYGQLSDDFSDGDFTSNPIWSGETSKFEVDGTFKLHLNASAVSDTAYLSTPISNLDFNQTIVWTFYVEMNFSPSNTNNARIYLVSDNANLRGSLNGYYLRIGENGSTDAVKIYKQTGTTSTLLFTGTGNTFATNPTASIRIERDGSGNWVVESDATGGTSYISEGSFSDVSYTNSQNFGIYCKFSATNNTNFWFDDLSITGTTIVDVTPPNVTSVNVISSTELDVTFNEAVDQTTAQTTSNYFANNGLGNPISATLDGSDPTLVHLIFSSAFTNGTTNTLTVQNVEDLSGNIMITTNHDFIYFVAGTPGQRSIVINEIFADPSPQIGLPDAEYIELYNPSSSYYDLNNWTVSDGSSTAILSSYALAPGEYVIIADDDFTTDFSAYPNTLFVTSLPSLNNSADNVILSDNNGALIDQVNYTDAWYQSDIKKAGGYSLEQINPTLPCSNSSNWIGSLNETIGGTPGQQNAAYDLTPDTQAPIIVSSYVNNQVMFHVCLSESIDSMNFNTSYFSIDNGITIDSIQLVEYQSCIDLFLNTPLDTGVIYNLTIYGLTDCSGNVMNHSTEIILPAKAIAKDIIINEVLYDPFSGGVDFVEVYNNSQKIIDLWEFKLANFDEDKISNHKTIPSHFLLKPEEFAVITTDSNAVKNDYLNSIIGRFVQISSLPNYSNDSGTVYLILPDIDSSICDNFSYNEDMQFGLINDPEGVSLERVSYNRPTNENSNWHSAAETVGWATPGLENSQYYPESISDQQITLEPEIFSPDNDGFEDILNIIYKMDEPGYICNITIYDVNGRIVRNLVQNELIASEGIFSWDGLNNQREKVRIGNYIVYFEVFNLDGDVNGVKKTCVVASKF